MFYQYNVASSVFFSVNKFYFRNFGRHLFKSIFFRSNIASSKTSFWARPLKTEHAKLIV